MRPRESAPPGGEPCLKQMIACKPGRSGLGLTTRKRGRRLSRCRGCPRSPARAPASRCRPASGWSARRCAPASRGAAPPPRAPRSAIGGVLHAEDHLELRRLVEQAVAVPVHEGARGVDAELHRKVRHPAGRARAHVSERERRRRRVRRGRRRGGARRRRRRCRPAAAAAAAAAAADDDDDDDEHDDDDGNADAGAAVGAATAAAHLSLGELDMAASACTTVGWVKVLVTTCRCGT
eukprot:scaffold2392_cov228-Prasinococcus_capsulatus_cf.AAC.2